MATVAQARVRSRSRFELYAWFYTRISGVTFLLMGAFNLIFANLAGRGAVDAPTQMRWAFFPISFHIQSSDVAGEPSWENPFWQVYSFLLITMAMTHGFNGLRVVLDDYVRHPLVLAWLQGFLWVLWLMVIFMAGYILFFV
ncbi:MAG TPA: hypothetical protein EYP04_04240 [Anaerolineae bacterium]|nr:hypothetical protein [Anaerolineae bacterium]